MTHNHPVRPGDICDRKGSTFSWLLQVSLPLTFLRDGRFLLLLTLVDGCSTGDVGLEAGVEVVAADLKGDEALAILTLR